MIKTKKNRIFAVFLLLSVMLLTVSGSITSVLAQDNEATIIVLSSAGGSTTPAPGVYNYTEGTIITLEATANEGFEFLYWVASGEFTPGQTQGVPNGVIIDGETRFSNIFPETDYLIFTNNPAQITCGYGYTYHYQAVFTPILSGVEAPDPIDFFDPFDTVSDIAMIPETTFVSVSTTLGGSTTPSPGRYLFGEEVEPNFTLTATPNEGFEFQHWIVTGDFLPGHGADPSLDTNVIADNPLQVDHGKGYTYNYEAVFTLTDMEDDEEPEPTVSHPFGLSPELLTGLIVVLIIAVIIAVAFGLYMYVKKK